ncbi:MAG: MFS transporter [bacterium]|nr:MFS transporter [bacterium]
MTPRKNPTLYLLTGCFTLAFMGNVMIFSVASLAGLRLAPSTGLATLPLVLHFVSGTTFSYPMSLWMRHFGRKSGFALGLVSWGLGGLISAGALYLSSFWLLCLGGVATGFFNATIPYYRFAAMEVAPVQSKARALALVMSGGVVSSLLGPEIAKATRAIAEIEFTGTYLSLTGLALLGLLFASFMRLSPLPKGHYTGRSLGEIFGQPRFLVALSAGMVGYGVMTFLMVTSPVAMRQGGCTFDHVAWVIEWHMLGMFLPSFFTGRLIGKFGLYKVLSAGIAFNLTAIAFGLAGTELEHFWLGMACLGIGWNFLYLGSSALLTETYRPEETARVQGINETLILASSAVASLSSGLIYEVLGWKGVNWAAFPLVLTVALLIVWQQRLERRVRLVD